MKIAIITQTGNIRGSSKKHLKRVEELQRQGHDAKLFPGIDNEPNSFIGKLWQFIKRFTHRLFELPQITKYDYVIINKGMFPYDLPPVFMHILKQFNVKLIFYTPDPIWDTKPPWKVQKMASLADKVIVTNSYLKDYFQKYNDRTYILPIPIDKNQFKPLEKNASSKPVIGWLGSGPVYTEYLKSLKNILSALYNQGVEFTFKLISAENDKEVYEIFRDVPFETTILDWVEASALAKEVNEFNIGTVPLNSDSVWGRGKSPTKILEYMACGIPQVSTYTEATEQLIKDGKTGYLARNTDEWVESLRKLIENKDLREKMSENSIQEVKNHYFENDCKRLLQILQE